MERLITLTEEEREEIAALSGDMVMASGDLTAKLQKHHLLKVETATERQAEAFGLSLSSAELAVYLKVLANLLYRRIGD